MMTSTTPSFSHLERIAKSTKNTPLAGSPPRPRWRPLLGSREQVRRVLESQRSARSKCGKLNARAARESEERGRETAAASFFFFPPLTSTSTLTSLPFLLQKPKTLPPETTKTAHVASAAPSTAAMAGDWMATASAQAAGRVSSSRGAGASSSPATSFVSRRRTVTMMPVGVPRVPYRLPKGGAWVWIDIWNCLVS